MKKSIKSASVFSPELFGFLITISRAAIVFALRRPTEWEIICGVRWKEINYGPKTVKNVDEELWLGLRPTDVVPEDTRSNAWGFII